MTYSSSAKICNKLYHVITEFVPTTFTMDNNYSHSKLETTNNLEPGSITWSRYIKPPNLCPAGQKVAHVIIGLTSKNATNKVIQYGLYIEGKHVKIQKTLADPRRCLKCQRFGHFAADCKAMGDTCAHCTLNHRTNTCSVTNLTTKHTNCPNETAIGHGAADRDCLIFIAETRKLLQRNPENKYKYYPIDDPTTWTLLSNHNSFHQDNT